MSAVAIEAGFLTREALISASVNALISAGFFTLAFGFGEAAEIWGVGNFVFDFLPQSFAVAFFASLVPVLLAMRSAKAGKIAFAGPIAGVGSVVGLAILTGLLAAAVGGVIWAAVFSVAGADAIGAMAALAIKVVYGFALGGVVTYFRLGRLLGARSNIS